MKSPYADALAVAATEAIRHAVAGDDAELLDAVKHLSPGERLNVYRAARRVADLCGATFNTHPNTQTPPLFAVLLQQYEFNMIAGGLEALPLSWSHRYHREMPPSEHRRLAFVRGNITRQLKMQGVEGLLYW